MKIFWYNITAFGYIKAKNKQEAEKILSKFNLNELRVENNPLIDPDVTIDMEDASDDFDEL